ncbi:MAG: hypothetical protein ABI723_20350 [Bacteroidia bacterium]
MTTTAETEFYNRRIYYSLIIAIAVTLFLFFIDEGYYNFNWMDDAGNWFAFLIYVFLLFTAQLLLIAFLFRNNVSRFAASVQHIGGIILGIASAFFLMG